MIDNPHFAFPFRFGADDTAVVVERDSVEHIDACAQVVIRCPTGFRDEMPDFGWAFPEFANIPIDPTVVEDALRQWGHPLGTPSAVEYGDAINAAIRFIDILESARV